jgi:hypothetical protein
MHACYPECGRRVQACLSVRLEFPDSVRRSQKRVCMSYCTVSCCARYWMMATLHGRSIPCVPQAALRIKFANFDCRDRGQHHRTSLRDVAAPFTLARQQRGKDSARRHFAPSTSVVSVAGTQVSHVLREYAPRFVRGLLHGSCSGT